MGAPGLERHVSTDPMTHSSNVDMDEIIIRIGVITNAAEAQGERGFVRFAERPARH